MNKFTHCLMAASLLYGPISEAHASEAAKVRKYQIGIHSMVAVDDVELSAIGLEFDDLSSGKLDGPHQSSVYLLTSINGHVRIGAETLVGNSSQDENTSMNFQGLGFLADLVYGEKFIVHGGLHIGGVIVNATTRTGESENDNTHRGQFFKDTGVFVAPYIGVGYRTEKLEFSVIAKWLNFAESESDEFSAFDAPYAGIGLGINF